MEKATFQKALEIIESLPEEQRESLIDIVKRRLVEERRDRLAQNIKKAKGEYNRNWRHTSLRENYQVHGLAV